MNDRKSNKIHCVPKNEADAFFVLAFERSRPCLNRTLMQKAEKLKLKLNKN